MFSASRWLFVTLLCSLASAPLQAAQRAALYAGTRLVLTNPLSGEFEPSTVVAMHGERALLRFSDGSEHDLPLSRVRLLQDEDALEEQFAQTRRRVVRALFERFGLDASQVPVRVLGRREFAKKAGISGAVGVEVPGPIFMDHVYLDLSYGAFEPHVWTHELVHYLAQHFNRDAHQRHLVPLVEGLTEHFAYQVSEKNFGAAPDPSQPYYPYWQFANALSEVIGDDALKEIFFGDGAHQLSRLRRALSVDDPGRLDLACRALGAGKTDEAIALLRDRTVRSRIWKLR